MYKMPRLRQPLAIALLSLLLGSGTLTLWAQQKQHEPVEPVPPEQRETQNADNTPATVSAEPDPDNNPVTASAQADADNTPATTSAQTDADDSPFDYQSSEKISEDLSVSFPVDI